MIAEFVSPKSQQLAEAWRDVALQKTDKSSAYGVWHREGNRYMHFNAVQPNGVLTGVTLYDYDSERNLLRSLRARQAIYQNESWVLEDVAAANFADGRAARESHVSLAWETSLTPRLLGLLVLEAEQLSLSGLWDYAVYLREQGINADEYLLSFWNKALQPFTIVGLVFVAITFIFGPLRDVTMGFRLFTGVLVGVTFRTLQDILGPASLVFGFPPVLAALVPIGLCLLLGALLMARRS